MPIHSPYINTLLYTILVLDASQMNNNIYNNLKDNLKQLKGKCYKQYGYISEIYSITERGDGLIIPENPLAAATFKVQFTCKLCNPLKGTQIICKIDKTTPILIGMIAGPMRIIALPEHINKQIFYTDKNNNLKYKINNTSSVLEKGTHVKITILSKVYHDMDTMIMVMANLDDIATKNEIEQFYKDEYSNIGDNIISFEEYMKKELEQKPKEAEQIEQVEPKE